MTPASAPPSPPPQAVKAVTATRAVAAVTALRAVLGKAVLVRAVLVKAVPARAVLAGAVLGRATGEGVRRARWGYGASRRTAPPEDPVQDPPKAHLTSAGTAAHVDGRCPWRRGRRRGRLVKREPSGASLARQALSGALSRINRPDSSPRYRVFNPFTPASGATRRTRARRAFPA
ncbi:hypothetical protein GCM10009548_24220 [Streptomyces malaysiensis subsp. malaysiensis]